MSFKQRAIEAALSARVATEVPGINWSLKVARDWEGVCRKCGKALSGSVADIKAHVCAIGDNNGS